ncbi:MAG: C40 family peptidase [Acidobacteriota bacterium]|nr:C40 family peptidase [Acidobacteriota bacterium]
MSMRTVGIAAGGVILAAVLVAAAAAAGLASLAGQLILSADVTPSAQALANIPTGYLTTYQDAAATCPGLPWTVLAGIGQVESDQGRNAHPSTAGAVGMMQELPTTFAEYALPIPPGGANPPSPLDPTDAIFAAARDLCANGARNGTDIPAAIYAYNHDQAYVAQVLTDAATYAAPAAAPGPAAATVVSYALGQIGTPYRWGGETPGVGFDCSGLTQAAYTAAGINIPRTSEAQWSALPHVPLDALQPGDLIFFNPGEFLPGLPGHVGIYIGSNEMVDAPHTGANVQIENLAIWPTPLGAARPTATTGSTQ